MLIQALDNLAPHDGKKLTSSLGSVKHAGWREVVDGMVQAGLLVREKQPLRPTRHPIIDTAAQALLLDRIRAAATGEGPLHGRDASLLALAGRCRLLEVAPDRSDRATAKRRIAEAAEQVPAAAAVRHVIEARKTAVIAGGAVATCSG